MTAVVAVCVAVIGAWVKVNGPRDAARKALGPLAALAALVLVLIGVWSWAAPRAERAIREAASSAVDAATPDIPLTDRLFGGK